MATGDSAVLDTDILVLLIGDEKHKRRTEIARARITEMRKRGYTFWIPAVGLAELATSLKMRQITAALAPHLGDLRVADFGLAAVEVCGRMVAAGLQAAHASGGSYPTTRAAMKFDAMIAATAHALGARYILTANTRDLSKYLKAVNSPTEVHQADRPDPAFAWQPELPMHTSPDDAQTASASPSAEERPARAAEDVELPRR